MKNRILLCMLFIGCYSVLPVGAGPEDAYRFVGKSIQIDQEINWQNWELQNDRVSGLKVPLTGTGIFEVDSQGLKPIYFRGKINVALDASTFEYQDHVRAAGEFINGGASALSNDDIANRVIDDDLSTYWEPDTPSDFAASTKDPRDFTVSRLREWELEVDLGRAVWVDSITVVFPAGKNEIDFLGDPLKSFALFISMGERFPFPLGTRIDYSLLGQVAIQQAAGKAVEHTPEHRAEAAASAAANAGAGAGEELLVVSEVKPLDADGNYLQVTFRPEPLDRADYDLDGRADIRGTLLQYLRLSITDSDFWRDNFLGVGEVGLQAYNDLPPVRRGARVYPRNTAGGFLVELTNDPNETAAEKYDALPEEKRGPIRYFSREVPRISEIQIWAKGDNYALRPETRAGGSYEKGGLGTPYLSTDGYYDTEWIANTWSPVLDKGTAWYDLGATFWADNLYAVMKLNRAAHRGAFLGHDFRLSDGSLLKPIRMQQIDDFPLLEDALKWENIVSAARLDNHDPQARVFQAQFPLRKVRYMQIRDIDITGGRSGAYGSQGNLAEVQLYGEGYPVSVWAFSPPILLTDNRGNLIRQTLPKIAWDGDAIIRQIDPLTGRDIEVVEPLEFHSDVRLLVQTRTSDQTDSTFTYFEAVTIGGAEQLSEISKVDFDALEFKWAVWRAWEALPTPHVSKKDDDGDGDIDEDPINFVDDDNDGKIDEDGKKMRSSSKRPKSVPVKIGELQLVGWSEWSNSYQATGNVNEAVITSPNPRKFLQVRVNIVSENPYKTARLRSIRIDMAPPLSLQLVGELALLSDSGVERPVRDLDVELIDYKAPREVNPLISQRYSYFIRAAGPDPNDQTVSNGFNEVLIVTPEGAELKGIRYGQVRVEVIPDPNDSSGVITTALESRFTHSFQIDDVNVWRDGAGNVLEVVETIQDSIYLRFPFSINEGLVNKTHGLVEVQLETKTYREGIEFNSFIRDSNNQASVFQKVDTNRQDATELVNSGTARPNLLLEDNQVINQIEMNRVITPNGDGANDELRISFTLLKILDERPIEVGIFDLSGRKIGVASNVEGALVGSSGSLDFRWDGRDYGGNIVAPGIYILRVLVEADVSDKEMFRVVHVAY